MSLPRKKPRVARDVHPRHIHKFDHRKKRPQE